LRTIAAVVVAAVIRVVVRRVAVGIVGRAVVRGGVVGEGVIRVAVVARIKPDEPAMMMMSNMPVMGRVMVFGRVMRNMPTRMATARAGVISVRIQLGIVAAVTG
jgi:hypothetical protein